MTKKRVLIVTGNQSVAGGIEDDVRLVFGDSLSIEKLYPVQVEQLSRVEADLILLTRWNNIGNLVSKVQDKRRILRVSRTIWESGLKQIMKIPTGSKVLVVNDSERTTRSMVELLMDLHIDGLTYVPYSPEGERDPDITIAITPGESSYVPSYIKQVIDVGNRHLDTATFMDICNILGTDAQDVAEPLVQYMNRVLCKDNISRQYRETLLNNIRMGSIMRHMEQGLLLAEPDGAVVLSNAKLEQIVGRPIIALRDKLTDILPEAVTEQLTQMDHNTLTLSIYGREVVVNHDVIQFGGSRQQNLFFFNDITYLHSLEQSALAKSRQKGFVARYSFDDIIQESPAMDECIERARIFAKSDKTVLIQGESGTGKELLAQSIHNSSNRRNRPFVAINCAALPESLLESELFGYEKGAFTGARQSGKMGLFEQANNGTIFLDEIGDMPFALQSRLLRVLQEKQVMRIGGDCVLNIDVRVIAATNQNLIEKMEAGTFRHDLYYRLDVLPCRVAALRERKEDIVPLFLHFTGLGSIPPEVAASLVGYDWPGNVRELQNAADYYMMMRGFENPLPDHVLKVEAGAEDAPKKLEQSILALLCEGAMGRGALMDNLNERGLITSEYMLRKCLDRLEQKGWIVKRAGRGGAKISEAGLRALGHGDRHD